ncbi:MAG TPA: sulfatase-like hydrolase/transferase, partial [Kiritimatiellia bacterium]
VPGVSDVLDTPWAKVIYHVGLPALLMALSLHVTKRAVRRVYTLLAPMAGLGLLWPITFNVYDVHAPPVPPALAAQLANAPTPGTTNVYIFMMDEWSYAQTFPHGQLLDGMPHLRNLLGRSTTYQEARSPGPTTAISIPRFLFQNNAYFLALPYDAVRDRCLDRRVVPGATLFAESPPDWYKLAAGFWVDYTALLGTNVDFAVSTQSDAELRTFGVHTASLLKSQFGWLRYLGKPTPAENIEPSLSWIFGQKQTHRWALLVIRRMNQPTFAYFHYCLPHYPYVWNSEGEKQPYPERPLDQTVVNYRDNLMYLDTVIGEIVGALEEAGKFDSSMLVLTSDHSWRNDPVHGHAGYEEEDRNPHSTLRHVPLVVKYPGQREARVVDDPVSTADVHLMVRAALAGATADDVIASLRSPDEASAE